MDSMDPPLPWRHNERYGVSNHRGLDCLLSRVFRRKSKKTSKLRVTDLCEGNSLVTREFPARRASNAENVSIWWRHHAMTWKNNDNKTVCTEYSLSCVLPKPSNGIIHPHLYISVYMYIYISMYVYTGRINDMFLRRIQRKPTASLNMTDFSCRMAPVKSYKSISKICHTGYTIYIFFIIYFSEHAC